MWDQADTDGSGVPAPVESVGRDLRWIMDTAPTLSSSETLPHENPVYWAGYLLPLLIVAGGFVMKKKRDSMVGQESLIRSRKAAKQAIQVLKQARTHLSLNEVEAGYDALAVGLKKYLADKLSLPIASLDEKTRNRYLNENQISESSREELSSIFAMCDSARFSPHGHDESILESLIDRAEKWVTAVDRRLKPARV